MAEIFAAISFNVPNQKVPLSGLSLTTPRAWKNLLSHIPLPLAKEPRSGGERVSPPLGPPGDRTLTRMEPRGGGRRSAAYEAGNQPLRLQPCGQWQGSGYFAVDSVRGF